MTGFRWTIKRKFLVLGSATLLPLLALIIFWASWEVRHDTRKAEAALALASQQAAGQLRGLIETVSHTLTALSHLPSVRTLDRASMEALLREVASALPTLQNLLVLAPDGRVIATVLPQPPGPPVSWADDPWFRSVMTGRQPAIGDFQLGRILKRPVVMIAVPATGEAGPPLAVFGAAVSLPRLNSVFEPFRFSAEMTLIVVDGQGQVLVHTRDGDRWIGRRLPSHGTLPLGPAVLAKVDWFGAGNLVGAVAPVAGTPWRVLVGLPRASIEGRVWRELTTIGLLLLGLLAVSSLIGLLIAQRIWRPLRALADAARKLPQGEACAIQVGTTDEVGELAAAFNAMAAQVVEARANLERRVAELSALFDAGRVLTESLELSTVLGRLAEIARIRLGMDVVGIWLWDRASERLVLQALQGTTRVDVPFSTRLGPNEGMAGWVITHRASLFVPDVQADPRPKDRSWMAAEGVVSCLCVPLLLAEAPVGVLTSFSRTRRELAPAEAALAEALAAQAALAVQNARFYEASERRRRATEGLLDIARAVGSTLELKQVLKIVAQRTAQAVGADRCSINLWREGHIVPVMSQFADGHRDQALWAKFKAMGPYKLEEVPAHAEAIRTKRPVVVEDAAGSPLIPAHWVEAFSARSILAVPLLHQEEVIGTLNLDRTEGPYRWHPEQIELAMTIARQAALAVENARVYEHARERARQLTTLSVLTRLITATRHSREVVNAVAKAATTLMRARLTRIWVTDPQARVLRVEADFAVDLDVVRAVSDVNVLAYGEGLAGRVAESGTPEYVEDVQQDPRWLDQLLATATGLHAYAGVPLRSEHGVLGVLAILFDERRRFTAEEQELMGVLADQAAIAMETARLFEGLSRTSEALATRSRQREVLHDAQRALIAKYDLASLLQYLVGAAAELIGARYGALAVLGEDGKITQLFTTGIDAETRERIGSLPEGRGLLGVVFRENAVLRLEDLTADLRAARFPPHHPPMRRLLAAPIRLSDRTLGAIYLTDKHDSFTPEDEDLLSTLCADAAVAIENARLVQELSRALEELRATQQQLVRSETLRAVGVLASGAAHHLNNLLAVILGNIQLLLERVRKPEIRDALELVEQTTQDAAEVVRRMQRFSRVERFARLVTVDLNALAREVLELARPLWQDEAQARGVQIEAVLDPGEIPGVNGEPAALREVFMNLLINAVEVLPQGGKITVKTWRSGPWVHCSVTDSGVGMTDSVRERAMEPFFTTKGPKSTGLGLSVSYGIIRRHGGELAIESAEERGTTATIRLPLAPVTTGEKCEPPTEQAHPLGILLIEDEGKVRETLARLLASQGHRVIQAAGGQEGLARLAAGEPVDLVLTDLGMPGMTGWEVARAVKAQWPHLPVGLITGWGNEPEGSAEDRSAADFVIPKPVTLEALRKALAGWRPEPAKRDGPGVGKA